MQETALAAGHRTTKTLFAHYLNAVPKEDALRWFSVMPV